MQVPPAEERQEQELGAVVLRQEIAARGLRVLRPLLFLLLFLGALDAALRLALPPDERVLRDPQNPYGCFRGDDLAELVAARRRAPALDVVLLGDSVLSATNNPPGERVEDYLAPMLRARLQRQVRVWNLGRGGAHAADLYGAARQLRAQVAPRGDLFVVLNTNIIFFSRRHSAPAMLFPCLAEHFADDAQARSWLRVPEGPRPQERRLTAWATRTWYLYQQRRRIAEALFGGPPRDALRERLLHALGRLRLRPGAQAAEVNDPNLPWTARGLSAAQFAESYEIIPFQAAEAVNYRMTQRLTAWLAQSGLPSLVFMTPQNHGLLGALADHPGYHAAAAAIAAVFTAAGVPFRSYDGQVADPLFTDLDHLTARGNQRMAALLAEDLAPRLATLR